MSLNWRLWDKGRNWANQESTELIMSSVRARYEAQLRQLMADVVKAYFSAKSALRLRTAKQWDISTAQELLTVIERREANYASSQKEVLQPRSSLARAQLDCQRVDGEWVKAQAELMQTIGAPLSMKIVLSNEADEIEDSRQSSLIDPKANLMHMVEKRACHKFCVKGS